MRRTQEYVASKREYYFGLVSTVLYSKGFRPFRQPRIAWQRSPEASRTLDVANSVRHPSLLPRVSELAAGRISDPPPFSWAILWEQNGRCVTD